MKTSLTQLLSLIQRLQNAPQPFGGRGLHSPGSLADFKGCPRERDKREGREKKIGKGGSNASDFWDVAAPLAMIITTSLMYTYITGPTQREARAATRIYQQCTSPSSS